MKTYLISLLSLCLFGLIACGPTVRTFKPGNADLSKYKSFAFLPNADIQMPAKSRLKSDDVNQTAVATLNQNMRTKGYSLDRSNPDLLVLLSVKTEQKTDVDYDPVYARYPYNGAYAGYNTISPYYNNYYYNGYGVYNDVVGYDTDVYRYKEGTLVIDLVDPVSKKIVWKGVSSTSIYDGTTTDALVSMIEEIFEDYPVTGVSAGR